MRFNISSLLLSITFLLWFIRILLTHQTLSKSELLRYFHQATDMVLGVYAVVYVVYVSILSIFELQPLFLTTDAALLVVLFYGGIRLLYPKILTFFQRQ